ncbi:hypothetical protein [Dactylosporangium sp. CA-233914]|uniref:hypothetical protein n=1 Tax=Dactylosporangium sp. CA-233914 TaxID=3239934 RepID=UPI003D943371
MDGGFADFALPDDDSGDRSALERALFDVGTHLYDHERSAMYAHTFDPASPEPPVQWCVTDMTADPADDPHHDSTHWHEEYRWWETDPAHQHDDHHGLGHYDQHGLDHHDDPAHHHDLGDLA